MSFEKFVEAYITSALWSSVGPDETPLDDSYDRGDISGGTLERMYSDCRVFYDTHLEDILCKDGPGGREQVAYAGHDFWLTRNGHGAGFWDTDWPEPHASRLADAARAYGEFDLYVGDDGLIWAYL